MPLFRARVDAEKDCDAGAGSIPVEQAFGGCGISQSLCSNERVIDLGEPGSATFLSRGRRILGVRQQSPTLRGFRGNLLTVDGISISSGNQEKSG
jgi:hypothetical protein